MTDHEGVFTLTAQAMAMDFTLTVVGCADKESATSVMSFIESDLRWVDEVFSTYREDSWISRINRGEAVVADAPPAVAEVLDLCEQFREETGGWFDAREPLSEPASRSPGASRAGASRIDPTGIVKTWAMERSRWRLSLLQAEGWSWGCAGDLSVHGQAPSDEGWRIGIGDPRHEPGPQQRSLAAVRIGQDRSASLATSGVGHRSGHIWAPQRGKGTSTVVQATVIGRDLVQCDAWATAIVAGGAGVAESAHALGMDVLALKSRGDKVTSVSTPGWRTRRL
ncbi:FAD:protein FMN transferase [Demequina sediminicola]|uniref:FAD:protein FMN transferase n=1 Tax=Demequina sediminicola TaxID=1095026 RepID=UPI0007865168|nr:FAD:protein FMN transferase [Demequina sediminicola]